MSAAHELRGTPDPAPAIAMIDDDNLFSYTPPTPWVAVGWRKPGDVQIPAPGYLAKKKTALESTGAEKAEPERNRVPLRDDRHVGYDRLVIDLAPFLRAPVYGVGMNCVNFPRPQRPHFPSWRRRVTDGDGRWPEPESRGASRASSADRSCVQTRLEQGRDQPATWGQLFLIPGNPGVHHSKPVKAWLAEHVEQMEVFHPPSYSPELNPRGRLNASLKHALGSRVALRTKAKLKQATESHMTDPEQRQEMMRAYFQDPKVKYAT